MKSFIFALAVCIICSVSAFEDKTITQYLADNGFTTLSAALRSTGLDTALAANGPYTIFAPTEAAFQKLGQATINSLSVQQLTSILKYHVISEFVLIPMVTQTASKPTLEGQSVTIMPDSGTLRINNGSSVDPANSDIIVKNGAIQAIDTVLIPPIMASESIAQLILKDDTRFKDLFLALLLADLVTPLQSGDYTLFAPVDSAFEIYKNNLLSPTAPNAQMIYQEVLKYHVVPGGRRASQIRAGQVLYTLHGTSLNVTQGSGGLMINSAKIVGTDILATNGVIHAINTLLIPLDLYPSAQGRR